MFWGHRSFLGWSPLAGLLHLPFTCLSAHWRGFSFSRIFPALLKCLDCCSVLSIISLLNNLARLAVAVILVVILCAWPTFFLQQWRCVFPCSCLFLQLAGPDSGWLSQVSGWKGPLISTRTTPYSVFHLSENIYLWLLMKTRNRAKIVGLIYFFPFSCYMSSQGHNESQGWCQSDYHKAGVEEEKGSPSLQTLPKVLPTLLF